MEVTLSAELQAKRARIAEKRGINPQDLAREAIERVVDYDEWFVRELDKGLAQVATSDTLTHEEVNHRPSRLTYMSWTSATSKGTAGCGGGPSSAKINQIDCPRASLSLTIEMRTFVQRWRAVLTPRAARRR